MKCLREKGLRKLFFEDADRILAGFKKYFPTLKLKERETEPLRVIHRYAHSLKGLSAIMGFKPIYSVSRELEELLKKAIDGQVAINDCMIKKVDNGFKIIGGMIKSEKKGSSG